MKYISSNFPGRDRIKIIIDLEMQIWSKNSLTERFIDYATELRLKNGLKKTLVIALVIRKNKKSSSSDLTTVSNIKKINSKNVITKTYDNIQIV